MRKQGLLARLEQIRVRSMEACDEDLKQINRSELYDLLMEYINDPQIREAAEKIPF